MRQLKVTAEGLRYASRWLADEPDPARRGLRASVFLYAMHGPGIFGCETLAEVLKAQRIPQGMRSTVFRWMDELDAHGLAWGRSDYRDEYSMRATMGLPEANTPREFDENDDRDGTFAA